MSITHGVRALLRQQPSIMGTVKPQTVQNITYPGVFTRNVVQGFKPPFIVIKRADFDPMECLDGTTGLQSTTLNITSSSNSDEESEALAKAIQDFFKDYAGPAGLDQTIKAVNWLDQQDTEDEDNQGGDQFQYAVTNVFQVQHQLTRGG